MQASLRLIPAEFAISRHHFKNKEEKKRFLQSWRDNKPWSWYWDGWNFFWILNQFNLFYVASDFGNRLKAYEKIKTASLMRSLLVSTVGAFFYQSDCAFANDRRSWHSDPKPLFRTSAFLVYAKISYLAVQCFLRSGT